MATTPTSRLSLADQLRAEILNGVPGRAPGTIMSGRQLAEHLGCARKTLIGAMQILEQEGLIRPVPKVGYVILSPANAFAAHIDADGRVRPNQAQAGDTVELVTTTVQRAPDVVAAALGGPKEMSVVLRQSVLGRSGVPWAVRELFVPRGTVDTAARLLEPDLVDEAAILDAAGLEESGHRHVISARLATGQETALLKSRTGVALSVQRVSYSGSKARSCEFTIIRADRVTLTDQSGKVPNYGESGVE
ncbi:GntR family transcriptional regulator [Streptomyces sp. 5.8]|uniref:GntR family transcriptional regulator n=1 Tax=Streptomyces sp. 5.8 TaxID=3406571 RepID=UPI003BB6DBAD